MHTFDRKEAERASRAIMQAQIEKEKKAAALEFEKRTALLASIKEKILPALVRIETLDGITGVGFYQHSAWLVSNAHIISNSDALMGARTLDYKSEERALVVERAFHRPSDNPKAPDVVILKSYDVSREERNHACLPTDFIGDEAHDKTIIFYVDLTAGNPSIKFLRPLSQANRYPMIYECEDGLAPELGCSGSPIIEARVASGLGPVWQFKVNGVLYARCSSDWYNANPSIKTEGARPESKLVCAIPVTEFKDILDILNDEAMADRYVQMSVACLSLGDKKALRDSESYGEKGKRHQALAIKGLKEFEDGVTQLNIALPPGLEKLWRRWSVAAHIGDRVEHPQNPAYSVSKNHSNHHIIPIADLLYLWDYLHHLDPPTLTMLEGQVKEEARGKQKRDTNALNQEIEEFYSTERSVRWPRGIKDIRKETEVFKARRLEELKSSELSARYGEFYTLLTILCSPNPRRDKTFFAWSYWNLFKGWEREYRADDPSATPHDRNDLSEKVKPSNFNPTLWGHLKEENGLYQQIQPLKKLREPKQAKDKTIAKAEKELLSSMKNLAGFWKKEKEKIVYPYYKEDWEEADSSHGHKVFQVASGQ